MIDTIRIVAPLQHTDRIGGGGLISHNEHGEIEWQRTRWKTLEGSYDSRLSVWTEGDGMVAFEGSPAKWFQGHNVFGTDDLVGLAAETLLEICRVLEITPTDHEIQQWFAGEFSVRRADLTYSYQLPTRSDVLAYIRAMEHAATMSHRGRGQLVKGHTLYFGQHSRRWAFKFYSKGQEIEAHRLPAHIEVSSVRAHADQLLRAELVLRSMELKKLGLARGTDWQDWTAAEKHAEKMKGLEMPQHVELASEELESLPPRLRAAYELHQKGLDTRQVYSRATWYRYRRELMEHGIDLSANIGNEEEHANVVKFRRTLVAEPVPNIPSWAVGTPLYFEPRVACG